MHRTPLMTTLGRLAAALGILAGLLLLGIGTATAEGAVAPTVTLQANGPGWITITFEHPGTDGLLWYYPEREGGGGTYTMGAPNQFIDTHLTPNTAYAYRVCAVYEEEEEPLCSAFQRERTLPAPGRPANYDPPTITDIEVTPDAIKVTWGPTGDYTKILVHLSDTLGNVDQREVQNIPNGSFIFPGLRAGALYRVILKGCSFSLNNGCGDWSPDVFITTPLPPEPSPPPGKPTLTLTGQTPTTVSLDFSVRTRAVGPYDQFLVYRDGVQLSPVTPKAALNGYAGSYTDTVQTFVRHRYHVCFKYLPTEQVCSDSVSSTPAVEVEQRFPVPTCHLLAEGCDAASPALPYGPDTCKQGFVWREGFDGDTVCVTPERRSQVRADNGQADARREPNGGAYGPETCKQGFVWREARPSDLVCVTPAERALVASENATANERRVVPR